MTAKRMVTRHVTAKLVIMVSPTVFLRTMPPQKRPSTGLVIISTRATDVSIHAVSPEFGVHFSSTAFFGSGSLAQAGPGGAGAAGAARCRAVAPPVRLARPLVPASERTRRHTTARSRRG